MNYLNAYFVSREFGGHEEGGWYYDMGVPAASVPYAGELSEKDREPIERTIADVFGYSPSGKPHRYHLPGEGFLVFKIEDSFAQAYPSEKPRYS
jgi:hypothetical protein